MSPMDKDEISQVIEIQKAVMKSGSYEEGKNKGEYWKQLLGISLTVVAMAVGATVWATSAHADIVKVDIEKDMIMRSEIEKEAAETYVPKYDFAIVREKLEANEKQHQDLIKTLDKMNEKIDSIYLQSRREASRDSRDR